MSLPRTWVALVVVALAGCGPSEAQRIQEARYKAEHALADAYRNEPRFPFARGPGEQPVEHPCGVGQPTPCILLSYDFYNHARGFVHRTWFMDSEGRELSIRTFEENAPNPVRAALADGRITREEMQQLFAAGATELSIPAGDVDHVAVLLSKASSGRIEETHNSGCCDGGGASLSGYLFDPALGTSRSIFLQKIQTMAIMKENDSPAARELAQWINLRVGGRLPFRGARH